MVEILQHLTKMEVKSVLNVSDKKWEHFDQKKQTIITHQDMLHILLRRMDMQWERVQVKMQCHEKNEKAPDTTLESSLAFLCAPLRHPLTLACPVIPVLCPAMCVQQCCKSLNNVCVSVCSPAVLHTNWHQVVVFCFTTTLVNTKASLTFSTQSCAYKQFEWRVQLDKELNGSKRSINCVLEMV